MDELGIILREAREAKGLTLAEVQAEIRIGAKFLEALETGQFQQLPTPVHARGYLRNYARFLTLDPQPLLERLEMSYTYQAKNQPLPPKAPELISADRPLQLQHDHPLFSPVNVEMETHSSENSTGSIVRIAIIIALLVTIALIATRIASLRSETPNTGFNLTEGVVDYVRDIFGSEEEATPTSEFDGVQGLPVPDSSNNITGTERTSAGSGSQTTIPVPTMAPTRPSLPATMDIIQLRIDVVERSWMRITIDGAIAFEGWANANEVQQYEANDAATVRTGNGIGVVVSINGVQLGRLGERQQVVEETWETTN